MPVSPRRVATGLLSALAFISQVTPPVLAESPAAVTPPTESCEQWVVTLKGEFESGFADALAASELANDIGARVVASVPQLHAHLILACGEETQAVLTARTDNRIRLAFPNVAVQPTGVSPQQWYLRNAGQPYYVGANAGGVAVTNEQARSAGLGSAASIVGNDIRWEEAQAKFPGIRGSGVTVAVVDTGVDASLPALADRIAPGAAAIDCALDLVAPYADDIGHGTAVASLIAANGQNGAMTGVAPDAKVLPVQPRCEYADFTYGGVLEYAMGVLYASDNADVINLSNGINPNAFVDFAGPGSITPLYVQALELYRSVIDEAVLRGAIVVASSGNGGGGAQVADRGILPGEYRFPASFSHVTSVGSTSSDGAISSFSQWNDRVDVAAPGQSVLTLRSSFVQNCGEAGDYLCFVNLNGTGGVGGQYWIQDGTSFSAPLVSGAAALAKQKWSRMTSDDFELLVRLTADDGGAPGYDVHFGAGSLNLDRMLSFNFPPRIAMASVSPAAIPGHDVVVRAQVENLEGDAEIAFVSADLGPIGIGTVVLSNVGPGIFESAPVTIPSTSPVGSYSATVIARDSAAAETSYALQVDVSAVAPPQFTAPSIGPSATSISITDPKRGRDFTTNERNLALTGTVSPDVAFVEINGQPSSYVAGGTTWSAEIELHDGENIVTVRGFNLARSAEVSDEVSIELDQDTPERVRDLTVSAGVLTWSASKSRDVEGYQVFKLEGKKAKRIGTTRKRQYSVGGAGTYAVIAEDRAGNALDPKKGASVALDASSSTFSDLPATHFARAAVESLVARGAVQAGTYFRPETPVTRGEFAKLLVLALGKKAGSVSSDALTDVSSAHSLGPFITAAVREGWAHGDGGRFYPDRPISRGEAALMLARARNLPLRTRTMFSDASGDIGRAAAALREEGIVSGVNGRFEPQRALLRGEAAKIVASP